MSGPAYDPESTTPRSTPHEHADIEQKIREEFDVRQMASEVVIDEIVSPSTLREELTRRFAFYEDVEKQQPTKKHATVL